MNTKDLVFYNKEGYKINTQLDENNIQYSSIYFDKNSTNTFKTQGIYLFENVPGSDNYFSNINMIPYQIFNTNGIFCYPSNSQEYEILDIKRTIKSVQYKTKWLYINNIHKVCQVGMYISLKGLNYIDPSLDEFYLGEYNVFQIKAIQKDRILIHTELLDNTINFAYLAGSGSIKLLNVIETGYDPSISTNPQFTNKQRFSLITNDINAGTYTSFYTPQIKNKKQYKLTSNDFIGIIPAINDKLMLEFQFNTDNITIASGSISFVTSSPDNYIEVSYIPKYLKIGDSITPIELNNPLLPGNDVNFVISNIDYLTNRIYVGTQFVNDQTVECKIVLTSNKFTIIQDIVQDNNNNYSLPVTYSSLITNYQNILYETDNLIDLIFEDPIFPNIEGSLIIMSDLIDDLFNLTVTYIQANNTQIVIPTIPIFDNVYPIVIDEQLQEMTYIEPNSSIYKRQILITQIGDFIVININGKDYLEPFDTDISTTLTNWVNTYAISLTNEFINISNIADTLFIESVYPNVTIFININNAEYVVLNYEYELKNIKYQLLININGKDYLEPFDTDDITTITNWVNTYYFELEQDGIIINNSLNKLYFSTLFIDYNLEIQFNIGYVPKEGDSSILKINHISNSSFDVIVGNKIEGIGYNFLEYFSVGQTISLSGSNFLLMNVSYTIIEIEIDTLTLSYQGPYTQDGPIDLHIVSDEFIKYPQFGLSTDNRTGKFLWSWKDTITDDFFLYDFSGEQLKPYETGFPDYTGPKPLCGEFGDINLKLNKTANTELKYITNPQKQQTIFETLEHILPWRDEVTVEDILPNPIQVFIGYNSQYEMWNKAKLYLDFIEDITIDIISEIDPLIPVPDPTIPNILPLHIQNYIDMYDNTLEIKNISPSSTINFITAGLYIGQKINLFFDDITNDNISNMIFNNNGKDLTIKYIFPQKIIFEEQLVTESSVQKVKKSTYPQIDNMGNDIILWRYAKTTIKVIPRTLATFDVFGESEEEENRYNIHLNNINKNILTMKDFFIFKEVDINEEGIDWIFLNRKRKELLEIYGEIFNHVSSYKSIIKAINYFGYNDLSFNEYFQNIDPENTKYGQIFNLELLNILDKSTKSLKYNNLAFSQLRNIGYIKTNVFSLGYKVTDEFGNFLNAYSLKEVQIKLLGLKRWLHEHIVPLGSKIMDINAKYKMQSNFTLQHETYMNKNYRVEEYSTAIYHDINIFKNIITSGSNTYDISVDFKSKDILDPLDIFYSYDIKTYNVEIWNNIHYNPNSYVLYNGKYYCNGINDAFAGEEPVISNIWYEVQLKDIPIIQRFRDSKHELTTVSFTINELLDPLFEINVYWHSGYATTYSYTRTYNATVYNEPATIIY